MRELWLAVNPKHTEPLGQTMMINAFLLVWREMLPAELRDAQQPLIDALGRG
jgi:hypothetical protein